MKRLNVFIYFFLISFLSISDISLRKNIFIIGKERGEGELLFPRQVEEGPDENIYVYDQSDAFIKVYSKEGKYLRRIAGSGQGPGEIQRANGVSFGFTCDRKLFFTESFGGHRWITLLELSGNLHKLLHLKTDKTFGIHNSFSLKDGGFLVEMLSVFLPEKKNDFFLYRIPQALIRTDSKGRIVSEIIRADYVYRISKVAGGGDIEIPFIPLFKWVPFKNNTIIFTDGLSKNFRIYNYEGKSIHEIKTHLPKPRKVAKKDLIKWKKGKKDRTRDKGWYKQFGVIIEKYKRSIYKKIPNLSEIYRTPEGNFLVSGPRYNGNKKNDYWLLDENGNKVVYVSLEAEDLKISQHFIFYVKKDADENILIYCIKRRGTEKEDLLKIVELRFSA